MRIYCFLALLWCAPAGAVSLAERVPVNPTAWDLYPENLLKSVSRFLASHLQFSGNSDQSDEQAKGRLNLAGNNVIWSSHDIALDFRDSASRQDGSDSQTLVFRYSLPVAGTDFQLAMEDSRHSGVVESAGQQLDAQGEYEGLTISGSRSLWSWQGLQLDSLFSHSKGTSRSFEESMWVSDSTHEISRLGLRCSGERELPGGFMAGSSLTALGGWETRESLSTTGFSSEGNRFHKLALSASLNRSFYTWDLGVAGRYQFAPDALASSEYLQIAGPSMMQGFNGQSMYVSEGGWVRLNARSPGYSMPFTDAVNSFLMVSVLKGWASTSGVGEERFRASTGEISLRLQGQGFHASMSVGQVLDLSGQAMQRPASPDISLSMSVGI
ncbi:ShlB/FhaC/HecB family hemolysin secretion/activation protein [Marinobacter subterrani]|uniref:ShlB/FhaC/HecB family hemolysin secretion/activation protein n=1 Tax=Marinobacter subterrani TaxID=1658765 RepID=UPI00235673CE|nr:ShlB/FhaC/HecB family hemolysin secretion/activation protein [Marinobacter subterrani]